MALSIKALFISFTGTRTVCPAAVERRSNELDAIIMG